jgi:hypothetical protein
MTIAQLHEEARRRFVAAPHKCFQRHIREVHAEHANTEQLPSLSGAVVGQISVEEARSIILAHEWLRSMPIGLRACYGLRLRGELLGAACFAAMGGPIRNICGPRFAKKAICLARGACVSHAPKNAGSFLVRWSCRQVCHDYGWKIFFAYADADAGEIGQIYQAAGWSYLGEGLGRREGAFHVDWQSPDGRRTITSNTLNHDKGKKFFRSLGWDETKGDPREFIEYLGWKPIRRPAKKKYVWFEGSPSERKHLKSICRYPLLPYPKREAKG